MLMLFLHVCGKFHSELVQSIKKIFRKLKDRREDGLTPPPPSQSVATSSVQSSQNYQHMKFSARPEHMLWSYLHLNSMLKRQNWEPTQDQWSQPEEQQDDDYKADPELGWTTGELSWPGVKYTGRAFRAKLQTPCATGEKGPSLRRLP